MKCSSCKGDIVVYEKDGENMKCACKKCGKCWIYDGRMFKHIETGEPDYNIDFEGGEPEVEICLD